MKTYTEKDLANMKKADLIALIQSQGNDILQAVQKAQEVQAQADKAQETLQEITGLSADRLSYEEKKYNESVTCLYNFPAYFTQDTVQFRQTRQDFLIALGRKYIQEVLQNAGTQTCRQAGRKARKASAGKTASRQAGKTVDKSENKTYSYICTQVTQEDLQETDKYTTLKKAGKTVARLYVMRDNKVKALVKEDTAKKAGLAYTLMKFNLPASVILQNSEDVDKLVRAF